ncbi:hypothetical protein GH733_019553 [Mirounga leonina]|nr:hypothetical protein GH733_019553 [Mirounga leonina]
MASKLLLVFILGPPGLAKGTVCQRIAQSFGLQHLFLWKNIKANTQVGDMAKQYLEKGLLVPNHVITCLMMLELENGPGQHWLLDGFPRTVQAEALDKICELDLMWRRGGSERLRKAQSAVGLRPGEAAHRLPRLPPEAQPAAHPASAPRQRRNGQLCSDS